MELERRLDALASLARGLEPASEHRREALFAVSELAESFLEGLGDARAFADSEDKGLAITELWPDEAPRPLDALLSLFDQAVLRPGLNPASAGHLAYIPGGGLYHAALGDYLAAVTNRYAGMFNACPGAVRMENLLLRWMASVVGYPEGALGNLTSGGSLAHLIGVVTARHARGIRGADFAKVVVYTTDQVHHCLDKTLRIALAGENITRHIAVDERLRMRPDDLERAIAEDRRRGLVPWLIAASAGTTNTGAVDPLDAIADIAEREGLWFHVDAAYGGFFLLCEPGRQILKGIERSHSLVLDPHKGLFLPYGTAAVLVRDGKALFDAHYYTAPYLQDGRSSFEEVSPADVSAELTKHFRGPRLWLPLLAYGLAPFRAAIEEKMLLARYFHERIGQIRGFEVGPPPELSVATFRYVPEIGDADDFNHRLVAEVQRDGRVFLSSTVFGGRTMLRLAPLCFRTHRDTVDLALEVLESAVARLIEPGPVKARRHTSSGRFSLP